MKREDYLSMKSICFLWRQSRCNLEVLFGVRAEKIKNKPNDGWKIFCRIQPSGVKDPEYSNGNAVGGDECIVKSLALRCTVAWSFGVMLGCERSCGCKRADALRMRTRVSEGWEWREIQKWRATSTPPRVSFSDFFLHSSTCHIPWCFTPHLRCSRKQGPCHCLSLSLFHFPSLVLVIYYYYICVQLMVAFGFWCYSW